MHVLVTGGAGYIGSHAALALLAEGHAVTILDDLSRGHRATVETLRRLGGDLAFVEADVNERPTVERTLRERSIDLVMHFAALAYVGESVEQPLRYWRADAAGALALLEAMAAAGVRRMVFSSTCATYGEPAPERIPIAEDCPQAPVNPYGRAKLAVEWMLRDHAHACHARGDDFACCALRYFNVVGADAQSRIGERHEPETHLVPICLEVAQGRRDALVIHGDDYPTPDGTCIRDYVHVEDLVAAHLLAMHALGPRDVRAYNVGIGRGASVREVLESCRRVTGHPIPARPGPRRPGDPPVLYADADRIRRELGWTPTFTDLDDMVASAWRWMRRS